MNSRQYMTIVEHYESCLENHGDTHLGVGWPRAEDVDTRFHIMCDLFRNDKTEDLSLLDFGCGLSHLYDYLQKNSFNQVTYSGLDLSDQFIDMSINKYPQNNYYCLDILESSHLLPQFDYVIINGIFTQKRDLTFDEMFDFFKKMIQVIFEKANKGIAFNVMSKCVDWEKQGAFHLPFDILAEFLNASLSGNFVFRHDYGLYEYTTYVYK